MLVVLFTVFPSIRNLIPFANIILKTLAPTGLSPSSPVLTVTGLGLTKSSKVSPVFSLDLLLDLLLKNYGCQVFIGACFSR